MRILRKYFTHRSLVRRDVAKQKKRRDFLERRISRFSIIKHITITAPSVWRLPRKFYPKNISRDSTHKKYFTKILSYTHSAYREAEWKKISSLQFSTTIFVFVSCFFLFTLLTTLAGSDIYLNYLPRSDFVSDLNIQSCLFLIATWCKHSVLFFQQSEEFVDPVRESLDRIGSDRLEMTQK